MTRRELLSARSNDVIEACLAHDVCLSEAECLRVRQQIETALLQVEREVWGKVSTHILDEHEKDFGHRHILGAEKELYDWCRAQQKALE